MTNINENADYFEQQIHHFWKPLPIKNCKDCLFQPDVFSLREGKEESYVKLLGIKIICHKCKKFIMKEHNQCRNTLHPDDATITIVIEEWNNRN